MLQLIYPNHHAGRRFAA